MTTQTSKAKGVVMVSATRAPAATTPGKRPSVARAEIIDKATRTRFESEIDAALKRRPAAEAKLGGAVRAIASLSPALRSALVEATQVMVRRGSYDRELYAACIRTLAEHEDRNVAGLLKSALASETAGGNATLSAASFARDPSLTAPLAKLAASRQSHLAFGAETARVARRESNGSHLTAIAPMIKESHRISLCVDLFVPLARSAPIAVHVAPALAVLRGAERHLGRWLVLADVATKSGDEAPLAEARAKSEGGPSTARAAWSLVAWALAETRARTLSTPDVAAPSTRPTVELVARLSDRPSADRDTTFLFRMARARASCCKAMLEALAREVPLADEVAIRAASYLARDYGREDMKAALLECAQKAKRDELRGLAVAALWDTADEKMRENARDISDELVTSRCLSNVAWGALVRARASQRTPLPGTDPTTDMVIGETAFRWVQWGWLE